MFFGLYLVILLRTHSVFRDGENVSRALLSAAILPLPVVGGFGRDLGEQLHMLSLAVLTPT